VQARIDSLQAARDSLTRQLAEQDEYVSSLSQRIDEAVADLGQSDAYTPEDLGDRIAILQEELQAGQNRMAAAQERIDALTSQVSRLRDSLNAVITDRDEALAMQRDSISALIASLDSMKVDAGELSNVRSDLELALAELETKYYTVYYVIGTRDELVERGVVEEEGGANVLLVLWRAGETLVPARNLEPGHFRAVDLRQATVIDLPEPGTYRIVSRQDTAYLDPNPNEDGRFEGERLRITDPERFWKPSPYLILVAEN
jgi:polyhydroxyalkanoate synthesis regulator phasin